MKSKCISISKFEQNCINEDAVLAKEKRIAISDGAGGGGLFAERWSQYLLAHLPDIPIENVEKFNTWIEQIWEPFYNECETDAKRKHSVNHVFSSPTSIINFTSKKPSYDDTRRSGRDNELLQRAQSDL